MISIERLKECLSYSRDTGEFLWIISPSKNVKAGSVAGSTRTIKGSPYRVIKVDGTSYMLHRLAWMYENLSMPDGVIDHIDGDVTNNRISNLRDVKQSINCKNRSINSNNTSGMMGVVWVKSRSRWYAQVRVDGKQRTLGVFKTLLDACCKRKSFELSNGFHRNHGRPK